LSIGGRCVSVGLLIVPDLMLAAPGCLLGSGGLILKGGAVLLDEATQIVGPVFHNPPEADETWSVTRNSCSIEPRAVHA